ncbi:MAG: methyltransferase domain-containing protein [Myxococcales bacterium]|nr:methyltransferase domain-containing protein [Myxococcales bacterium]
MDLRPIPEKLQRLADAFDRFAPRYDRWFGRILDRAWEATAAALPVEPGARVLDLCTGTGGLLDRFAARGADVVGVDVSEGMLAKAAEKLRARGIDPERRLIRANVAEVNFPPETFDFVTLSLGLHEMPTAVRREALSRMARLTRRYLLLFDYYLPASLPGRVLQALLAPWEWFETPSFLRHYLWADLPRELKELGLEVVEVRRVRGLFPGQGAIWIAEKRKAAEPHPT